MEDNPEIWSVLNLDSEVTERWLPIPGYEGLYEVSDLGRVRSLMHKAPLYLRVCTKASGYAQVALYQGGKSRSLRVHRMVMAAFVGPSNGRVVDHLNSDRADNRICNLEYVTSLENTQRTIRRGRWADQKGTANPRARLTESDVQEIRKRYAAGRITLRELSAEYGVTIANVSALILRKTWAHVQDLES